MSNFQDQEQATYTATPAPIDLTEIIATYNALLAGDNLPERVAIHTLDLRALLDAIENKPSNRELILAQIAERLIQWDKDYPVNCYNGYTGLKELESIIADAVTILSAGRITEA